MNLSPVEALALLRRWNKEQASVRLGVIAPGFWASYSLGHIADISATEVTFVSRGTRAAFDIGLHSTIRLEHPTESTEVMPTMDFDDDDCALAFTGGTGAAVVVLKVR